MKSASEYGSVCAQELRATLFGTLTFILKVVLTFAQKTVVWVFVQSVLTNQGAVFQVPACTFPLQVALWSSFCAEGWYFLSRSPSPDSDPCGQLPSLWVRVLASQSLCGHQISCPNYSARFSFYGSLAITRQTGFLRMGIYIQPPCISHTEASKTASRVRPLPPHTPWCDSPPLRGH